MPKINPFEPNSPINPAMFVGRLEELARLKTSLVQTRADRPRSFTITGERGIGKSSLLNYLKFIATGAIAIDGEEMKFLVIDTDIDRNTTQLGLVKKIELGLRRELGKSEKARTFLSSAWAFLQRVEAGGVKLQPSDRTENEELILEEFSYSLAEVTSRVCNPAESETLFQAHYDGILILVDEADNASDELSLGSFSKLLTERLQRRGCSRVMFGLAGLPELRQVLLNSHPSSLRLFEEMPLDRLSDREVGMAIDICLDTANKGNTAPTDITPAGRQSLILFAEGYPHFIQQFGFSAFETDSDNLIDEKDVGAGAFGRRGALELIGDRYYRNDFYNKIQKESYRQVLRIMADKLDQWVSKADIRKAYKGNDKTLDNAIQALRDRKIILSKEGERGVYRLQHKGFALWIKFYTTDPSTLQRSLIAIDGTP